MTQFTSFQIGTFNGHEIMVNEKGQFSTDDGDGGQLTAWSLDILHLEVSELEQKRAKSRKLNLPVLFESGKPGVLTGFNIRTGDATGLGTKTHVYTLYPDVPWIRQRLAHVVALRAEAATLSATLEPYSLGTRAGSRNYGNMKPDAYVAALDEYEQKYLAKRAAAEANAPEEEA